MEATSKQTQVFKIDADYEMNFLRGEIGRIFRTLGEQLYLQVLVKLYKLKLNMYNMYANGGNRY